MTEVEFVNSFDEAIHNGQICVYYQPKFNHSTGRLVGAEALMRWNHSEYGLQSPLYFIPVLEKHRLIYRADLCVFEQVCQFLKNCPDSLRIPISFNVSHYDLLEYGFIGRIEDIRKRYDIPVKYLRAEITESSAIGGVKLILSAINEFHKAGYLVAMDDFGSGYSSLSILKNLPVDILKLDLRFLADDEANGRGGIIINSAVQMAKWLETYVIAEGVETVEQADFLKSIGCDYIQGYLYSKPLPEKEMKNLLNTNKLENVNFSTKFIRGLETKRFWNPDSLETIIFNSFVGAAVIFRFKDNKIELLRVNQKYLKEFGLHLTEKETMSKNPLDELDRDNKGRTVNSGCCGIEQVCIRSDMRVIGKDDREAIIYAIIHNVTKDKKAFKEVFDSEQKFRFASEQANVYAWEYIVDTKEMHPCFRCMRDLGLPPVVKNYPEPAIKVGIFPPDYADMYRDWHKQIANGVKELEAVIPLTVGRVPFHVRYTTVFDENGKPWKAYGSATLVVDNTNSVVTENKNLQEIEIEENQLKK